MTLGAGVTGDVWTFACNSGYFLDGLNTTTCLSSGQWTQSTAPQCRRVLCPSPVTPANGDWACVGQRFSDTCALVCNTNAYAVGSTTMQCQANGTWTAPGSCLLVQCPALSSFANGSVVVSSTLVGGQATYACARGFNLIGSATATCLSTGAWSTPPICTRISCAARSSVVNYTGSCPSGWYNEACNLACNAASGLVQSGLSGLQCTLSGTWTPRGSCIPATCSTPSLSNAVLSYTSTTSSTNTNSAVPLGTIVSVSCNAGYVLQGASALTCNYPGQWSTGSTCAGRLIIIQ